MPYTTPKYGNGAARALAEHLCVTASADVSDSETVVAAPEFSVPDQHRGSVTCPYCATVTERGTACRGCLYPIA